MSALVTIDTGYERPAPGDRACAAAEAPSSPTDRLALDLPRLDMSQIDDGVPANRGMVTVSIMLATIMQVVDTTIVNVALPHMQGSMSATQDQISWVLTSYIVTAAIFTPLTGVLSDKLGRKRVFLFCVVSFVFASMLCGAAASLEQIVLFRALQGAAGAGLVPLSQATLLDVYPRDKQGSAMALWGLGVMVGPVLGPTLGGYLTEYYSWRWAFYINLPVGILAVLGILAFHARNHAHRAARLRLLRLCPAQHRDRHAAAHARPRQLAGLVRQHRDRARGDGDRTRAVPAAGAHVHERQGVHRAGAVRRSQLFGRRGAHVHGRHHAVLEHGAATAVPAGTARLPRHHGRFRHGAARNRHRGRDGDRRPTHRQESTRAR